MTTVGVVGGGQLAQMLHQAAIGLGLEVVVLDPDPRCSAALAGARHVEGTWTSVGDLLAFARSGVDVVTFDHELTAPDDVARLDAESPVPVWPAAATMLLAQDKRVAREALAEQGLPVPAFAPVASADEARAFGDRHGWPIVLKARRGGYDGRGVWFAATPAEAAAVFAEVEGVELLAEERVDIAHELAVMVARRPSGQVRAWPPLRTTQVDGICTEVLLGSASSEQDEEARALAVDLAERIGLVGVMAVELFATADGALVVNELACRPHNSGHVTMDSCATGQFEQHLRAVLDLPLGDPAPYVAAAAMVNVLGGPEPWDAAGLAAALEVDGTTLHLYGKGHRPGRKLGHVNAVGHTVEGARDRARRAAEALGSPVW